MKTSLMHLGKIGSIAAVLFSATLLMSCAEEEKKPEIKKEEPKQSSGFSSMQTDDRAQKIFYALPSPLETANILKKAGASYQPDILHNTENVNQYETADMQAINLGIYGTDLSYSSIYNQSQQCLNYLAAAKRLANKLGLDQAFSAETMGRIEKNLDNKDTLLAVISESYWQANSSLQEGDRQAISTMVVAGGWLEGLFIACNLANTDEPNQQIVKRIGEQRFALSNLMAMVADYDDNAQLKEMGGDLGRLSEFYASLKTEDANNTTSTNLETGVTTVGGPAKELVLDEEALASLTALVTEIRNKYIA